SGFLVLVGPVNEDVEVVACLGGDGDELLVVAEIIHQGGVAIRGQGRTVLGFLHDHIAVVGGILRRKFFRSLGKGSHGKAHHQHQGGAEGRKGFENFLILHGRYPPVRCSWRRQRPCQGPYQPSGWRAAAPGSAAARAPSEWFAGSPPRVSAPPGFSACPCTPRSSRGPWQSPGQCAGFCS